MTGDPVSWLVVEHGWTVTAADGTEVGSVRETLGDEERDIFTGFTISTGMLSRNVFVPSEAVAEIREGRVELALSAGEVAALEPYEETPRP